MKRMEIKAISVGMLFAAVTLSTVWATPGAERLQQGLYAEEIEGDVTGAIASYQMIVDDPAASENHIAQALYRLGMCHLKLDNELQAASALTQLVSQYPGQSDLVTKANSILEKLTRLDPAMLMPPETLAYLQLGSPGKQIETLLGTVKGTPYENPLSLINLDNPAGQNMAGNMVAGLLNPSMLAEFQKIQSAAIGLLDIGNDGPSLICMLNPGESDALRGILLAALGMGGTPGQPIEGMSTFTIQGQIAVAVDERVIIAAVPAHRLPWSVRQYKHISTDDSLANTSPSFSKVDMNQRQQNAITLWANVDSLYARLQQFGQLPPNIQQINAMINLEGIDDLVLSHAIHSDGLGLDFAINLKEGEQSMAYEMLKTPKIGEKGLKGVPAEAFSLFSLCPAKAGSLQATQLKQLAQTNLSIDLSDALFDSVEQITLFALPGLSSIPEGMPMRPGLVITCQDPQPIMQFIQTLTAMAPVGNQLCIDLVENTILVSLERDVVELAKAALLNGNSVHKKGSMAATIRQHPDHMQKLILLNARGMAGVIESQFRSGNPMLSAEQSQIITESYASLARQLDSTMLSVHSEEQPQSLVLKARLSGIPPWSQLIKPISDIQDVVDELNMARRTINSIKPAPRMYQTSIAGTPILVASSYQNWPSETHPPEYAVDGDLATRWSAEGTNEWLYFRYPQDQVYSAISISFYQGDLRTSSFEVEASDDGSTWTNIFSGQSSGTTTDMEVFTFDHTQTSRLFRVMGHGNSGSAWNSYNEIEWSPLPAKSASQPRPTAIDGDPDLSASSFQWEPEIHLPVDAVDGDPATRWSAKGPNEWIRFHYSQEQVYSAISISFYNGDSRSSSFDVEVSDDGSIWTPFYSGQSSGTTTDMEVFTFDHAQTSRRFRVQGHGNSENSWNSYNEIKWSR